MDLELVIECGRADLQEGEASLAEVRIRMPQSYSVNLDTDGPTTSVYGEIDRIPWGRCVLAVEGLRSAYETTLGLNPNQIGLTPTLNVCRDQATAGFVLRFPRPLDAQNCVACDVAARSYVQLLRSQDDEVTKDMFEGEHEAAVAAGRAAAMNIRRQAHGANLPQELRFGLLSSPDEAGLTIAIRIGEHPDPMTDAVPDRVSGRVVCISTRRRFIELEAAKGHEEFALVGSPDGDRSSGLVVVGFPPTELERVLALPLGRNESVTLDVSRSVGRGKQKLTLSRLPRDQS